MFPKDKTRAQDRSIVRVEAPRASKSAIVGLSVTFGRAGWAPVRTYSTLSWRATWTWPYKW